MQCLQRRQNGRHRCFTGVRICKGLYYICRRSEALFSRLTRWALARKRESGTGLFLAALRDGRRLLDA